MQQIFYNLCQCVQDVKNDISKNFGLKGDFAWNPFTYEKRIADAAKVGSKKG